MLVAPIPLCKYKGDAITKTKTKHPKGFKIQDTRYKIQSNNICDYTLILITAIMCSMGATPRIYCVFSLEPFCLVYQVL